MAHKRIEVLNVVFDQYSQVIEVCKFPSIMNFFLMIQSEGMGFNFNLDLASTGQHYSVYSKAWVLIKQ